MVESKISFLDLLSPSPFQCGNMVESERNCRVSHLPNQCRHGWKRRSRMKCIALKGLIITSSMVDTNWVNIDSYFINVCTTLKAT